MNEAQSKDPITIADIAILLLRHYKLLMVCGFFGALIGGTRAFLMDPVYRAEALVAPVKSDSAGSGLSGLSGQLGGLASLAGLSLSGSASDRDVEAVATVKSRTLAQALIRDNDLLPILFSDQWDANQKKWKIENPKKIPTLWDANRVFDKEIRKITEDKKTGLVTISVEWTDPKLAADWVSQLISRTNQLLRRRAIERSEKNIEFLKGQLDQTGVIEVRQSVYKLMENEIKNIMLAQGSEEYAFKIIDPAVIPERKIKPKRAIITALGLATGLMLASIFVLLTRPLKKQPVI